MKTKTSFGRCLSMIMKRNSVNQVQLSERTNVDQSTISKIISKNRKVDDEVAKSLCNCWEIRSDNIQLLIAGLCDVIRRWGFEPDEDVEVKALDTVASVTPTQADLDLEQLRSHMADDNVAGLVHDLATILRRADAARATYAETADRSGFGSSDAAEQKS